MFETSRPQTKQQGVFLMLLPVSLGLHALAAIGALLVSVWKVDFPSHSPMVAVAFQLAQTPPPPPPPPPPPARAVRAPTKRVIRPAEIVAPTTIPDTITPVEEEPPPPPDLPGAVEGGDPNGVEGGEIGGVEGGVIGGVITEEAPKPPPPVVDDGRLHVDLDVPLPSEMRVIAKPYPDYPARAILKAIEDRLVVRYVIGKNGRVRDVTILEKPQHEMFERPTLVAVRSWRFSPLIRDGERQEVVHDVTVYFKLTRNAASSAR
jgi:protein TonB